MKQVVHLHNQTYIVERKPDFRSKQKSLRAPPSIGPDIFASMTISIAKRSGDAKFAGEVTTHLGKGEETLGKVAAIDA